MSLPVTYSMKVSLKQPVSVGGWSARWGIILVAEPNPNGAEGGNAPRDMILFVESDTEGDFTQGDVLDVTISTP